MNAPDSVLTLIRAAASDNDCMCGHHACSKQRFRKDLLDAHAALAELIDAAKAYSEAEEALANRELMGINAQPYENFQARVHAARRDLDAALARAGGAS